MTYTIKLKPPSDFSYGGTFFEKLDVTVFEPTERTSSTEYERKLHARVFGSGPVPVIPPAIYKVYQPSDRRYNPIRRDWKLDDLITKLDLVLSFGKVTEKTVERHSSFVIERDRPEDRLVKISPRGICLNEWPFEPLYADRSFDSFGPAIAALKDIQAYLREQGR